MNHVATIRPELLAANLEKLENFELAPRLVDEFFARPDLVRVLVYLQHVSQPKNYAGGLAKFAHDLIAASLDLVGTVGMDEAAAPRGGLYNLPDAKRIVREMPSEVRGELFEWNTRLVEELCGCERRYGPVDFFGPEPTQREIIAKDDREFLQQQIVDQVSADRAHATCVAVARVSLAEYLKELCERLDVGLLPSPKHPSGAPWYFARIADALCAFVAQRAVAERARIGETEVTRLVSKWTAKSRRMKQTVMIVGNSRFGKTEAINAEASAQPGHCRIVQTPPGNSLPELLREVAKSLGLEVGPQTNGRTLAERIDYCLRFLKLQLIFDEAQFLLPASYSRNSAPARLNWLRRTVMDQQIAAVLVCTPQYLVDKKKFEKATGFAMQQFEERIDKTLELPTELDERDLLAVARVHFPDLAADYLQYVVSRTMATERNYISDIAKIARHARDHAEEHGRSRAILADINAAIADVLPTIAPAKAAVSAPSRPANPAAGTSPAVPLQASRRSTATRLPARETAPTADSISRRQIQPVTLTG